MAQNGTSTKRTLFVATLLAGARVGQAAEQVGISRRTAARWLADPAVARALQKGRQQLLDEASRRLAALTATALDQLDRLLAADDDRVRLRAARLVLEHALGYSELVALEERVARLEDQITATHGRRMR